MRLEVNANTLTIDDLIQIEEGNTKSIRGIRDLLARFAVADDGAPLAFEAAQKALGSYTLAQLLEAAGQIKNVVEGIKERAVSPTTSGG